MTINENFKTTKTKENQIRLYVVEKLHVYNCSLKKFLKIKDT